MTNFFTYRTLGLLTAPMLLVGCGSETGPIEVTEVREYNPEVILELPELVTSEAERFRYERGSQPRMKTGAPGGAPVSPGPEKTGLTWKIPDGWSEEKTTSFRMVNLRFGADNEGELYLTRLPGGGGGLLANVNRWRGQMGMPDATEAEVAALPTKPLFNEEAKFLSLEGDFSGMGASEPKKNYKMLGLILETPKETVFVKMTGPKQLVEANATKFDAFLESLKEDGA